MNKQIEAKILELQDSAKKVDKTAKELKNFIEEANIEDTLKIQFIATVLQQDLFGTLQALEEATDEHARKIFHR